MYIYIYIYIYICVCIHEVCLGDDAFDYIGSYTSGGVAGIASLCAWVALERVTYLRGWGATARVGVDVFALLGKKRLVFLLPK